MTTIIQEFWDEISHLAYMSAVINYKDNKMTDIIKRYGLKSRCRSCGQHKP